MSGIPGEGLDSRQIQLLTVTSTCLVLSTLAIGLRLLVRWWSAARLWWDDCVAVLALVRLSVIFNLRIGDLVLLVSQVTSWLVNIFTLIGEGFPGCPQHLLLDERLTILV